MKVSDYDRGAEDRRMITCGYGPGSGDKQIVVGTLLT